MSIATLIIGESGTGKSTSLRHLDPAATLLIQVLAKPLPFKSTGWKVATKTNPGGSIFVTDQTDMIIKAMKKTTKKIIVVDDWNLTMTNEYMRRSTETGFQKFGDIGRSAWELMMMAAALPADVRVYLMGHSELSDQGHTKAKTIGKMIDQTCPVESMFTIVLRAALFNSQHIFYTQNNGQDTCKSPIGLFAEQAIPNDLAEVDAAIFGYYDLGVTA